MIHLRPVQPIRFLVANIMTVISLTCGSGAAAQEYPEFAGVYVKVNGQFIQVEEVTAFDNVTVYDHYERLFTSLGDTYLTSQYARITDQRYDLFLSSDLEGIAAVNGQPESIFVRSRLPVEEIFYGFVPLAQEFTRIDSVHESSKGAYYVRLRANPGSLEYTFSSNDPRYRNEAIVARCGWNTSAFSVRFVDSTSTEFIPNRRFSKLSPRIGKCGEQGQIKVQVMSIGIGNEYYPIRIAQ